MPVRSLLSALESQGCLLSPEALDLLDRDEVDAEAVEARLLSRDDLPLVVDADLLREVAETGPDGNGARPGTAGGEASSRPRDGTGAPEDRPGSGDETPEPGADRRAGPGDGSPASGETDPGEADSASSTGPETDSASSTGPEAESPASEPGADGTDGFAGAAGAAAGAAAETAPPAAEGGDGAAAEAGEARGEPGLEGVADRAPDTGDPAETAVGGEVETDPDAIPDVEYEAPEDALPSTEEVPAADVGAFDHDLEVLLDITGESTSEGELSDFTRYFNDRLRRLRKLLGKRREMVGMVPVEKANESRSAEVKFAGIVKDVRTTSSGGRLIEVEDETGLALVFASQDDPDVLEQADAVVEDEVVGFVTVPGSRSSDLLILQDVVHPGVPVQRTRSTADREVAACFISDVHVGAQTFLPEDWERFVRWINGQEGTPEMKRLARKVRYLVVAGDVVDGVGIFPGQRDELAVPDGEEQYRIAGEQFGRLRDDLQIVLSPGNHDLVRQAEPQPALPEKYARHFPENVTHVANPCLLEIEGVRVLVYHGTGIDDWIQRVSGLSYDEPLGTMKEMLRRRHLLPMYGVKTPIAPEPRDHLVVESTPDVFVGGHVHKAALDSWREVTIVNSSCWQGQTPFQKRQGIVPEPGRAAVVELDTGGSRLLDFHREGGES